MTRETDTGVTEIKGQKTKTTVNYGTVSCQPASMDSQLPVSWELRHPPPRTSPWASFWHGAGDSSDHIWSHDHMASLAMSEDTDSHSDEGKFKHFSVLQVMGPFLESRPTMASYLTFICTNLSVVYWSSWIWGLAPWNSSSNSQSSSFPKSPLSLLLLSSCSSKRVCWLLTLLSTPLQFPPLSVWADLTL